MKVAPYISRTFLSHNATGANLVVEEPDGGKAKRILSPQALCAAPEKSQQKLAYDGLLAFYNANTTTSEKSWTNMGEDNFKGFVEDLLKGPDIGKLKKLVGLDTAAGTNFTANSCGLTYQYAVVENIPKYVSGNLAHIAVFLKDTSLLKLISEEQPEALVARNNKGKTPLELAIIHEKTGAREILDAK